MNPQTINRTFNSLKILAILLLVILLYQCKSVKNESTISEASNEVLELKIKPSTTDSTIIQSDIPHFVKYKSSVSQSKLLLFLPGTNGIPERGPKQLFNVAMEQGYKVINLSYINKQSVARICKGENLEKDSTCTEKFRTQRIFGTQMITLILDEPQDGIINRFMKLLIYLNKIDAKGNWDLFIDKDKPNWNMITVAGQSQGGGMAAFIAKKEKVNRIITFSGGWDFCKKNKIANWYYSSSVTPANRWFGIYHQKEPKAEIIAKTYEALAIPKNHIFPLNLKIRKGKKAHGEGIRNIAYRELWKDLLILK